MLNIYATSGYYNKTNVICKHYYKEFLALYIDGTQYPSIHHSQKCSRTTGYHLGFPLYVPGGQIPNEQINYILVIDLFSSHPHLRTKLTVQSLWTGSPSLSKLDLWLPLLT